MSSDDATQAVVRVKSGEDWWAFVERLRRPEAAAKQVGALLVRTSQKAFKEQRLGEFAWKPRSVTVSSRSGASHLANVAGILQDMKAGRAPPARRFEPTPALVDFNGLRHSIASKWTLDEGRADVVVGSTMDYAAKHQGGGETSIEIDDTMKANLHRWIQQQQTSAERGRERLKKSDETNDDQRFDDEKKQLKKERREGVADGLVFLLHLNVWRQRVPARPFLGVPPEAEDKIRRIFALNVARPENPDAGAAGSG